MRFLLDKSIVRKILEGLVRANRHQALTPEQKISLNVFRQASLQNVYITIETYNLLKRRLDAVPYTAIVLSSVTTLIPTKYARRWTRRLREMGFTGEDAKVLGMAALGTDKIVGGEILGVHKVVTLDKHLATKYNSEFKRIEERFEAMVANLRPPFCYAALPEVETPEGYK